MTSGGTGSIGAAAIERACPVWESVSSWDDSESCSSCKSSIYLNGPNSSENQFQFRMERIRHLNRLHQGPYVRCMETQSLTDPAGRPRRCEGVKGLTCKQLSDSIVHAERSSPKPLLWSRETECDAEDILSLKSAVAASVVSPSMQWPSNEETVHLDAHAWRIRRLEPAEWCQLLQTGGEESILV
ncbi:hypothetical protein DQ04_01861120 [Trypanosoma grayi]|uniref:hypothetical protein n=1 Tax=Trypanosoma grayi TaxID=71804 RepID=UPI0004F41ECB|nr:hypothetical protein DQ04_01861120 [Trypanosoma grayi]KEG12253.1 hypothetical protein DQ04_01861120 [Trypanosoma grayi]